MAFNNSITLAQSYLPILDEVYKAASRTSLLDNPNAEIINGNTVKYYKTSMDGLGNYARNSGFVDGAATGTWETMTLTQDRGRGFQIDKMDDEETLGQAFGTLAGEFIRTKVVPEIDAYTFAKIAGTSNISAATPADITVGSTDVPGLVDEAERQMNEDEVPAEGRLLFISETAYAGLRSKVVRQVDNSVLGVNREIETYDNMPIIRVPQSRFYTKITLKDGTSDGQTAGGYVGTTSTGYKLNFLVIHPSAIMKVVKHAVPRIFAPEVNQSADAWKFQYRIYHDCFVYANKLAGVYMHRGSTALS